MIKEYEIEGNALKNKIIFIPAAYGLVERGVHTINGISVSFILNHPEAEYQNSGLPNDLESGCTVEIGGSVKDIWSDVLVTYFQNKNTSGGGKIKEQNLNKSPPTVTFVEREGLYHFIHYYLQKLHC